MESWCCAPFLARRFQLWEGNKTPLSGQILHVELCDCRESESPAVSAALGRCGAVVGGIVVRLSVLRSTRAEPFLLRKYARYSQNRSLSLYQKYPCDVLICLTGHYGLIPPRCNCFSVLLNTVNIYSEVVFLHTLERLCGQGGNAGRIKPKIKHRRAFNY